MLVESEIPLDAAPGESHPTGSPDYLIGQGEPRPVPLESPPGRPLTDGSHPFGYWVTEDEDGRWRVRFAGACDGILDRSRREVILHPAPDVDPEVVSIIAGGGLMAHILAAEGRLGLHASAVEDSGRAVGVLGYSGSGKSTMACLMIAAGARLITDDLLRCDPVGGQVLCFPGARSVRLRPKVARLAERVVGARTAETADGRLKVTAPEPTALERIPLAAIVACLPAADGGRLEIQRLAEMEAVMEVLRNPRLGEWIDPEQLQRSFELSMEVARRVPVLRASVPWDPHPDPAVVESVLSAAGL